MKRARLGGAVALVAATVLVTTAHANEPGSFPEDVAGEPQVSDAELPVFELELQYRPRFEQSFGGDVKLAPPETDSLFTHRARIGANVWYRSLRGHVSMQNVRLAGVAQNQPPIELFEAYIETHGRDWGLRVGSQMMTFSTGRVLTGPRWPQRSRTIDAVRFVYDQGDLAADLFAGRYNDGIARDMFGTNLQLGFGQFRAGMPILVETNEFLDDVRRTGVRGEFSRITGGFTAGTTGRLSINAEALLQLGDFEGDGELLGADTADGDMIAYLLHADVGYSFDEILSPVLWVDYLSGDSDHADNEYRTFDTITGYRHRFYGKADRFVLIPRDTGNGGLIDLALKNASQVGPGRLDFEYHYFFLAEENVDGDDGAIGTEVDLSYRFLVWDKVDLSVGTFWFLPLGDFRDELGEAGNVVETDDLFSYHYIQLDMQLP